MSSISPLVTQAQADEHVFLIGRPPMAEFFGFIENQTVEGREADRQALADIWRAANDRVHELEAAESDVADAVTTGALPESVAELRERVLSDPIVQRSFAVVPIDIAMIELDALVVFQKHINLAYASELEAMLGAGAPEADLFRFCLPFDSRHDPPIRGTRTHPNAWTLASPSTDFRVLDFVQIDARQIGNLVVSGAPLLVVGAVIGYGSNYLTAVSHGSRLVLKNGSHRAYALRKLGYNRVPCLIEHVSRPEELELIGAGELYERRDLYLDAPRPPLLRDYFDDRLRMIVNVPRQAWQIRVGVNVETLGV